MRYPRIKPQQGVGMFMHVYNRAAGCSCDRPFGDAEKETFVRHLRKVAQLYTVEVLAYQCMGNHFHALVHVPPDPPSVEETARRFERYWKGKRRMAPDSAACAKLRPKLRDISEFISPLAFRLPIFTGCCSRGGCRPRGGASRRVCVRDAAMSVGTFAQVHSTGR